MTSYRDSILLASLLFFLFFAGRASAVPGSVELFVNDAGASNYDWGDQTYMPPGFGDGEFTLEMWLRPNNSFPVGSVSSGSDQRENWAIDDEQPYSDCCWWFKGNFLLDGHNNDNFSRGTFDLQFYGGGRIRWLFGDGSLPSNGEVWSVGAYPASSTPTLLDGQWHQVTLVRRWSGTSNSQLEMWIDGVLIDTETTPVRTNMRQWWDNWAAEFPPSQEGWFWGAEKQAAIGALSQYEDYKGLIDELRFWSRAKSAGEISSGYAAPVTGNEPGLVGWFDFGEAQGDSVCDRVNVAAGNCIFLRNAYPGVWSSDEAPLTTGGGDTTPPSTPGNLQATAVSSSQIDLSWNPSSDNVGVVDYQVRRNGVPVGTSTTTSFSDTGLAANTMYSYTVTARDAAGNSSQQSAAAVATTLPGADTQAPTTPTGLQGVPASTSRIDLTWNASSDNVAVTGYVVQRDGNVVGTPAGTSFADTGLVPNTTYSYTVAARDAAGNTSQPTSPVAVTTLAGPDQEAPTIPTNVTATARSDSRIDIDWTASTDNVGVVAYEVRRDGTLVDTINDTTFIDTGLAANTSYSYTVTALDAAGNASAQSAAAAATTLAAPDTQPPSVPANLQGNALSSSRVGLTWNASSDNVGVTEYRVLRNGTDIASTTATAYTDSGLLPATQYSYTVVARDFAGNESAPSAAAVVTTDAAVSAAPGGGGGGGSIGWMLFALLLPLARAGRGSRIAA